MESKSIFMSKTFWVNILAIVVMVVQTQTGFVIDAEYQAAVLMILNLVLRAITKQPVDWGKK